MEGRRESRGKEGSGVEVRKEKNSKAFHEDDGGRKEKRSIGSHFKILKPPLVASFQSYSTTRILIFEKGL